MGKIADFSYYQSDVDWSKAKHELDLAVLRVQYGSMTVDKKLKEYVAGCIKYKIPFGHYAFFLATSVSDAVSEAKDFLKRADKSAKFLVVDVERCTVKNKKDLVPATQAFIDTCKKAGWKVGLYTGHSFYSTYGMHKVNCDFLWIPIYKKEDDGLPTGNKPSMPAHLWQYTQSGKLLGVSGHIDLNQIVGEKDLNWFLGVLPKKPSVIKKVIKKVIPKKISKPKKKYIILPSNATSWNVYPTNKAPVVGNEKGELKPNRFGGLTYQILGNPQKDVYTIKTDSFGKVNIYAASSTKARIVEK